MADKYRRKDADVEAIMLQSYGKRLANLHRIAAWVFDRGGEAIIQAEDDGETQLWVKVTVPGFTGSRPVPAPGFVVETTTGKFEVLDKDAFEQKYTRLAPSAPGPIRG